MRILANFFKQQEQSLPKQTETYADLVGQRPRLLSGAFSKCAHTKWGFGSSSDVSDETGTYLRVVGDCRQCKKPVVSIMNSASQAQLG